MIFFAISFSFLVISNKWQNQEICHNLFLIIKNNLFFNLNNKIKSYFIVNNITIIFFLFFKLYKMLYNYLTKMSKIYTKWQKIGENNWNMEINYNFWNLFIFFFLFEDVFMKCLKNWDFLKEIVLLVKRKWPKFLKMTKIRGNSSNNKYFPFF